MSPILYEKTVAMFDLDGTLRKGNLDREFVITCLGFFGGICFFLKHFSMCIESIRFNTERSYQHVFHHFFKGKNAQEMRDKSREFIMKKAKDTFHQDMMQRYQWHVQQGHECIIISSSWTAHLIPYVKLKLGTPYVFGSELEDVDGYLTGYFLGPSCNKEEKIKRLISVFGAKKNYLLYAYGDTYGDIAIIDFADHGYYMEKNQFIYNGKKAYPREKLLEHFPQTIGKGTT